MITVFAFKEGFYKTVVRLLMPIDLSVGRLRTNIYKKIVLLR